VSPVLTTVGEFSADVMLTADKMSTPEVSVYET